MVKPDRELYEPPYDDALMYDTVEEPQGPRGRPLIVLLGIVVLAAFAAWSGSPTIRASKRASAAIHPFSRRIRDRHALRRYADCGGPGACRQDWSASRAKVKRRRAKTRSCHGPKSRGRCRRPGNDRDSASTCCSGRADN